MKKKYCKGWGIGQYILYSLFGIYLLTAGLIGDWSFLVVMKSSIFWGLFFVLMGVFHGTRILHKR